jgi:hypothetical protein
MKVRGPLHTYSFIGIDAALVTLGRSAHEVSELMVVALKRSESCLP